MAGGALLLLVSLLLAARRLAGALTQALALPTLLLVAGALVGLAVLVRLAIRFTLGKRAWSRSDLAVGVALSIALVTMAAALSLPGTWWTGLLAMWGLVALEEAWAWGRWPQTPGSGRHVAPRDEPIGGSGKEPPGGEVDSDQREFRVDPPHEGVRPAESMPPETDEPPDEEVTQQLTRSRAADGSETLSGWLRVVLAAGQRNTNLHVAFCPPFLRTPHVSVDQVDGPETRIKTVQILPYGARCDLKLAGSGTESPSVVLLRLTARCEADARGVAATSGEET
jgi:hypothetical protein